MSDKQDTFLEEKDFSKLVKKARRMSILRNTLISAIVCSVFLFVIYFLGSFMMNKKIERASDYETMWHQIAGANIDESTTLYEYSPFSASSTTFFIKNIHGVPMSWGSTKKVFTFWGTSKEVVTDLIAGHGYLDDERIPLYYRSERLTEFFHPNIRYEKRIDERPLLNEIADHKVVEYAFSFDKAYTLQEVENLFSDHIAWYWVDTFSESDIKMKNKEAFPVTILGTEAIGFQHIPSVEGDQSLNFTHTLEWLAENRGEYQDQTKKMIENITNNKEKLTSSQLEIIGVVVTGTPKDLKKYNNLPAINAAVLGATADKY